MVVAKRKAPIAVSDVVQYHRDLKDQDGPLHRIFSKVKVRDMIYLEHITIDNDFTFGLVIKIVDNPVKETNNKSLSPEELLKPVLDKVNTAIDTLPKENINFEEAELYFSKDLIDASATKPLTDNYFQHLSTGTLPSFGQGNSEMSDSDLKLLDNPSAIFFVNGIRYKDLLVKDLKMDQIESIEVVKGLNAKTLYGVEQAVLITTKAKK